MKLFLIICLSLISLVSFSQRIDSTDSEKEDASFITIEIPPAYEKGYKNLMKGLKAEVTFDRSVSGIIFIGLTVDSTGRAYEFNSLKGFSEAVDVKLIKALEKLQKWSPARNQGRNINCKYVLKIEIEKGEIKTKW